LIAKETNTSELLPWMDNAMGPLGTAGEPSTTGEATVKAIAVD